MSPGLPWLTLLRTYQGVPGCAFCCQICGWCDDTAPQTSFEAALLQLPFSGASDYQVSRLVVDPTFGAQDFGFQCLLEANS